MKYYHGFKSHKNYFEGWFFKHDSEKLDIAFIPSISIIDGKVKKCYIQVITNDFSHTFEFPYSKFRAKKNTLMIEIDHNIFSEKGITLNLVDQDYKIKAILNYSPFQKLKTDIMGFFRFFPFMECRHKIFSMKHFVTGTITINDQEFNFDHDLGYIEKDFGTSFPTNYTWIQCNNFQNPASFFFSKATIPYLGLKFNGLICALICNRKEYRFATYNCARLIEQKNNHITIKKRKLRLDIEYVAYSSNQLLAPEKGAMIKHIHECLNGECKITLSKDHKVIFQSNGRNSGIELR